MVHLHGGLGRGQTGTVLQLVFFCTFFIKVIANPDRGIAIGTEHFTHNVVTGDIFARFCRVVVVWISSRTGWGLKMQETIRYAYIFKEMFAWIVQWNPALRPPRL